MRVSGQWRTQQSLTLSTSGGTKYTKQAYTPFLEMPQKQLWSAHRQAELPESVQVGQLHLLLDELLTTDHTRPLHVRTI